MIEVICNDRIGRKIRVKCNPDDTIGDLKKLIAAQCGTRWEKIRIQKWYNIYKDHITLEDYEIKDGMGLELYYIDGHVCGGGGGWARRARAPPSGRGRADFGRAQWGSFKLTPEPSLLKWGVGVCRSQGADAEEFPGRQQTAMRVVRQGLGLRLYSASDTIFDYDGSCSGTRCPKL
eukprot:CAMPEP_0179292638 /NCGR_PEP_ID=MMETSP0797-20121207/42959_1 /TAXON_ID=47934 /ORGANISM="Dinophysis acuminata, Strain DAEP01" /LENGTH=175 /DNA_ID=CAMNT_0021001757 /DNA_START=78 /DNA_END=603 /DNA_ORIENTATION=-